MSKMFFEDEDTDYLEFRWDYDNDNARGLIEVGDEDDVCLVSVSKPNAQKLIKALQAYVNNVDDLESSPNGNIKTKIFVVFQILDSGEYINRRTIFAKTYDKALFEYCEGSPSLSSTNMEPIELGWYEEPSINRTKMRPHLSWNFALNID